jgi:hypothetical protein
MRITIAAAALAAAAALVAAGPAAADVLELDRGLGATWLLGSPYRLAPGRARTAHYTINSGNACPHGPGTAATVDWYRNGVRTAWKAFGASPQLRLIDVATTRRGDSSPEGFVVGRSTFAGVHARLPRAKILHPVGSLILGSTLLSVTRVTGYDNWADYGFWFDRRGRLVALETDRGGC